MYIEPDISSSYKKVPVFGEFLYQYVMKYKPKTIVEFGTRCGYSAVCMGQALRDLGEGKLYTYDNLSEGGLIQANRINDAVIDYELEDWVYAGRQDFYEWIENPTPFDLLHVDVDNNGDVIKKLAKKFRGKHVIFEGGIPARDEVRNEPPMVGSAKYTVLVWDFPGLSKLGGKRVNK